ncbi:hypothetical protein D3C72_2118840 [compost metagenome]
MASAREQRDADVLFQKPQLARHRGLHDIEQARGRRHASRFRNRHECLELLQIHRLLLVCGCVMRSITKFYLLTHFIAI